MAPHWLNEVALFSLLVSVLCALVIATDITAGSKQKMGVMNVVWPITALWSGPLGLAVYWTIGRRPCGHDRKGGKPMWGSVLVGDTHCGAGCTIGDFIGEWIVFLSGLTIGSSRLWADYTLDFACAFLIGIAFQYFSIAPMRGISGWEGIKAAIRADTVSLVSFEIGMFLWMWLSSHFLFHPNLNPTQPMYWFMMQVAMLVGFLTAYPANWWLVKTGVKEPM